VYCVLHKEKGVTDDLKLARCAMVPRRSARSYLRDPSHHNFSGDPANLTEKCVYVSWVCRFGNENGDSRWTGLVRAGGTQAVGILAASRVSPRPSIPRLRLRLRPAPSPTCSFTLRTWTAAITPRTPHHKQQRHRLQAPQLHTYTHNGASSLFSCTVWQHASRQQHPKKANEGQAKLKIQLKLSISRLRMVQQKDSAKVKQQRREMAQLIEVRMATYLYFHCFSSQKNMAAQMNARVYRPSPTTC